MANIRNHDSWVHSRSARMPRHKKPQDLVRMAAAKSFSVLSALQETDLPVSRSALVVGAGLAGMTAALSLARQGYPGRIWWNNPNSIRRQRPPAEPRPVKDDDISTGL